MNRASARIGLGLLAGAGIAAVDNFACGGEVSPIVIVVVLVGATGVSGLLWGKGGLVPALAVWVWLPSGHLVKHLLGMPDTLHPNTYASIGMLAAFSFVVSCIGACCGVGIHRLIAPSGPNGRTEPLRNANER